MPANYPDHMWLAGDGEGVILVCEGDCPGTPAGDLVIAEYGMTNTERTDIPRFRIDQLTEFVGFASSHARKCVTSSGNCQ